jgi:DeoR/GlpR family transcriptional regulator of sugar metabolism
MLKEERQKKILDILDTEQRVVAKELTTRLGVSEDTIRRDLRELDENKQIKRVHSGAIRVGPPVTSFIHRETVDSELKKNIAKKAIPFLKMGSTILIDGSTTNLELVKLLPIDFACTIITNSPPIAVALVNHPYIDVIMLGGNFYKQSMINLGVETYTFLEKLRVDLYIIGIYNIDPESGMSVPTKKEAEIKRKMIDISSEVLGMATNDKLGTVSNYIVGDVNDLNYLISKGISASVKTEYTNKDVIIID